MNIELKNKKVMNPEHIRQAQCKFHRRGFTLIEVLIASAIFASMLVMTTGIIAQTSNYQGRLKAMRETSEETRRLADMITRDVRSANASFYFPNAWTSKNGVMFTHCIINSYLSCSPEYFMDPILTYRNNPEDDHYPNFVSFANSNETIMYFAKTIDGQFYLFRKTYPHSTDGVIVSNNVEDLIKNYALNKDNAVSNKNLKVRIDFAGFVPMEGTTNIQQPFVKFRIVAETSGTGANYYKAQIDSTVTGRSYNQ